MRMRNHRPISFIKKDKNLKNNIRIQIQYVQSQ